MFDVHFKLEGIFVPTSLRNHNSRWCCSRLGSCRKQKKLHSIPNGNYTFWLVRNGNKTENKLCTELMEKLWGLHERHGEQKIPKAQWEKNTIEQMTEKVGDVNEKWLGKNIYICISLYIKSIAIFHFFLNVDICDISKYKQKFIS